MRSIKYTRVVTDREWIKKYEKEEVEVLIVAEEEGEDLTVEDFQNLRETVEKIFREDPTVREEFPTTGKAAHTAAQGGKDPQPVAMGPPRSDVYIRVFTAIGQTTTFKKLVDLAQEIHNRGPCKDPQEKKEIQQKLRLKAESLYSNSKAIRKEESYQEALEKLDAIESKPLL